MGRTAFAGPRGLGSGEELLSIELLEEHARRLAALLTLSPSRSGSGRTHQRQLKDHMRALRELYVALADDARQEALSPAAEWLLDNFHIISAAARDIHHDLPPAFFRRLPRVASDEFAGWPRIYALALELIRLSAGRLDAARMQRFISAFQAVTPLTMGELWGWPSALKLALVDHLRARADVLADTRRHRIAADRMAARIDAASASREKWPAEVHHSFVTRLLQHSRGLGALAADLYHELDVLLEARGQTLEDVIRAEGQHQATAQAGFANLITSLRLISTFDWSEFFEGVSLVEQVLQRDPSGVYGRMDFRSRDRYRHAIEELAAPTGEAQLLLTLKCVERARQVHVRTPDARAAHVGYHLIGNGRREFERSIAWRPDFRQRIARAFFALATPGYLGTIAAGTAALVAIAVGYAWLAGWRGAGLVFIAALAAVPASELTIQLLQRLISFLIPPRRLPRLELDAVPPSARTMVIVPTLLDSVERVADLIEHLEVQALGNLDSRIHFALLTDFLDAPEETLPRDREILDAASDGIRALNAKHAAGGSDRFFLFHRFRQWNPREGLWMGWERKRGKIEEFNRLLRGATDTSFAVSVGDLSILPDVKYCITLDSDTRLPRGVARELIGIITHPLNRADDQSESRPGHRGLRHPAASSQRDVHERRGLALCPALFRTHRRRPLHHGSLRYLPGPLRRRHLHGQGALRRRCVHGGARTLGAGERAAVARSVRRAARARRARLGCRAGGRIPVERAVTRAPAAPLDSGRLADPLLAVPPGAIAARPHAQHAADHRAVEDSRQSPAQPRRANAARDARGRMDPVAGTELGVDADGHRGGGLAAPARRRTPARRAGPCAVDSGVPAESASRHRDRAGSGISQRDVSRLSRLRHRPCHRRHPDPSRGDEAAAAGVGNGGDGGRTGHGTRRTGTPAIRRRDGLPAR